MKNEKRKMKNGLTAGNGTRLPAGEAGIKRIPTRIDADQ
jgi:hypothetical protein